MTRLLFYRLENTTKTTDFLRVGQRSQITVGQRGKDNYMQNGQFRTACRTQKCLHPHTFLWTQIQNVLRKVSSKSKKRSIYIHVPKDRNCEVCLRTKMTRAPCRRRTGEALPRVEKFGDWITADHKVPNDDGEYRNNHRYAVVVQDLATFNLICAKQKLLRRRKRVYESSSSRRKKYKAIYTDNLLEFGKSC